MNNTAKLAAALRDVLPAARANMLRPEIVRAAESALAEHDSSPAQADLTAWASRYAISPAALDALMQILAPGASKTEPQAGAVIFQSWHAWEAAAGWLLSDERSKELRHFANVDDLINWLYATGNKEAARAINQRVKK